MTGQSKNLMWCNPYKNAEENEAVSRFDLLMRDRHQSVLLGLLLFLGFMTPVVCNVFLSVHAYFDIPNTRLDLEAKRTAPAASSRKLSVHEDNEEIGTE